MALTATIVATLDIPTSMLLLVSKESLEGVHVVIIGAFYMANKVHERRTKHTIPRTRLSDRIREGEWSINKALKLNM